jgi:uncharacterized lipoprotein YajG
MNLNVWRWLLLAAVVLFQAGCATERQTYDDTPPADAPHEDDSHGWGTSIQNAGK